MLTRLARRILLSMVTGEPMGHEEAWHKKLEEIDREARIRGSGVIPINDRTKLPDFIANACIYEGRDTVVIAACEANRRALFRATRDLIARDGHPKDDVAFQCVDGPGCARIWFYRGKGKFRTVARFFWGGYDRVRIASIQLDERLNDLVGLAPLALVLHDPYHMDPLFGRHALSLPTAHDGRAPITVVSGCVSECGPLRPYHSE